MYDFGMNMDKIIDSYPKHNRDGCPHCKNHKGFVCGMCVNCGYDYLSGTFKWVKLWYGESPETIHEVHFWRTRVT